MGHPQSRRDAPEDLGAMGVSASLGQNHPAPWEHQGCVGFHSLSSAPNRSGVGEGRKSCPGQKPDIPLEEAGVS